MPEDITSDGQLEGGNPSDAEETVSESDAGSLNLSELNQFLGKNFPTKEAALKSIKDTYSYTGKVGQLQKQIDELSAGQAKPDTGSGLESTVRELQAKLEETTFLSERPDFKEYLPTLRELRKSTGKSMSELVASEAYKPLFEKALAQDATQKKRSVLESNPRLGQVRDKFQEARESLEKGNYETAKDSAVSGVLEAYDLK